MSYTNPRVYLCVPVYRQVYSHFLLPYTQLLIQSIQAELLCGVETPMEKLIPQARNEACEEAIRLGATHVFFLDDDVTPPPDALTSLLSISDDNTVVGGLYCNSENEAVAYTSLNPLQHAWPYTAYAGAMRTDPMAVVALGMGCTLIPTALLRRVGYPWFSLEYRRQDATRYEFVGEDIWFFDKLFQVPNTRVLLHTGVCCGHLKQEAKSPTWPGV